MPIPRRPPLRLRPLALSLAILLASLPALPVTQAYAASCAGSHSAGTSATCVLLAKGESASRRRSPGKRGRHAKHKLHRPRRTAKTTSPMFVPAVCEDASAPIASGGSFSCADGSEPSCADASKPVLSASGASLLCRARVPAASSQSEADCEGEGACTPATEDVGAEEGTTCEACERPSDSESED